jgi:hypothetical protein
MMKVRGSTQTVEEANDLAENIIRNVDSYSKILTTYVGKPFPVAIDTRKFTAGLNRVDINRKINDATRADIRAKREEDKKIAADIRRREEAILEETKDDHINEDPTEVYAAAKVKYAQNVFTYCESAIKYRQIIRNVRRQIKYLDEQDPSLAGAYYKRITDARSEVGLSNDISKGENNWMKYMCDESSIDADLAFDTVLSSSPLGDLSDDNDDEKE